MTEKVYKIFIIDDDPVYQKITQRFLENNGFEVISAYDGKTGIKMLQENEFDVLLLDKNLPDMTGIDILRDHFPENKHPVIIMATAAPSIKTAVDAMKLGADNYVSKPFDSEELLFKIQKELKVRNLERNVEQLKNIVDEKYNFKNFIGNNKEIQEILDTIIQLKNSDVTILLTGETGTGKSILAKIIHHSSERKNKPFVTINAGTIAENVLESELFGHVKGAFTGAISDKEGLFKSADGGTIFIDEIGDMPPQMQIKFLRVLQEKEFEPVGSTKTIKTNCRIVAATNQELKKLVQEKKFREDLYYRLNVVNFELPPLRKRKDDVPFLSQYFVVKYSVKNNLPVKPIFPSVMEAFMKYEWPGNIRELENCLERMVLFEREDILCPKTLPAELLSLVNDTEEEKSTDIEKDCLEYEIRNKAFITEKKLSDLVSEHTDKIEKMYLTELIKKFNGHITNVAKAAGLDRKTVYRKMEKLGIDSGTVS